MPISPRAPALASLLAVVVYARAAGSGDIALPGPAPRAKAGPVAGVGLPTDEGCARCHEEIAAEWRGSLHRRAFENGYFLRAYALEKTSFCRKCHAPSADPEVETPPEARALGVGCTACHVVPAGIVGTRALAAREGGHAVIGDARLGGPEACGGCHDFPFPGQATPMQDTLAEHRRSASASTVCQACHMPPAPSRGGGQHRSHAFRVQGDPAMMARAVQVKGAVIEGAEVRITIAPGAIGHAFPTGDLFRRAEVRVTPLDGANHPTGAAAIAVLGRSFRPARGPQGAVSQEQVADTRLTGPRTITLSVPAGTRRARWEIVWQRLPPDLAERLGMSMRDQEMTVLQGVVTR